MSVEREKLTGLKENFWKINEAANVVFQNDKVTVYGPIMTFEDMQKVGQEICRNFSSDPKGQKFSFEQYINAGQNIYVIVPKAYPKQKYIVSVDPKSRGEKAQWFDVNDQLVDDEQVLQLHVEFGMPHELLGEAKK